MKAAWRRGLVRGVSVAIIGSAAAGLVACAGLADEALVAAAVEGGELEPDHEYSTFANRRLFVDDKVSICHAPKGARLRSGPGKQYMVKRVLPNGRQARIVKRAGTTGWYRLRLGTGTLGWTWRGFLCLVDAGPQNPADYNLSREGIINISRVFRGYSYWWGGAAFPAPWDSPESKPKGRCTSSTYGGHQGRFGADCSGFVGKVWKLPPALPFASNRHPFSTYHFYYGSNYWRHIARGATRRADALVYHSGGGGHILIFERGDPWGNAWAFEAKGCAYGIVRNLRLVSSSYRARRRKGI